MDSERSSGDSTCSRKREGYENLLIFQIPTYGAYFNFSYKYILIFRFYTEVLCPKRPKSTTPDTDGLVSYGKFFILG